METKTQKYLSSRLTPEEVIAALVKAKQSGRAAWWKNFDFEIVDGFAKLKCIMCGTFMSQYNNSTIV
jgi:hypothetical protein